MCEFKPALSLVIRAAKRAAFVSEEFRFGEVFVERRAVKGDEGAAPQAAMMHSPGDELLAGAARTVYHHRRPCRRDLGNHLAHACHLRRLSCHAA